MWIEPTLIPAAHLTQTRLNLPRTEQEDFFSTRYFALDRILTMSLITTTPTMMWIMMWRQPWGHAIVVRQSHPILFSDCNSRLLFNAQFIGIHWIGNSPIQSEIQTRQSNCKFIIPMSFTSIKQVSEKWAYHRSWAYTRDKPVCDGWKMVTINILTTGKNDVVKEPGEISRFIEWNISLAWIFGYVKPVGTK